jgi:GNAT superfamily N-acetyltransferase
MDHPLRRLIMLVESADLTDEAVRAFAKDVESRLGLKTFDLFLTGQGDIKLNLLVVDKSKQKQGSGSEAMEDLCRFADRHGRRVVLVPAQRDPNHGTTSSARLKRFYKRFGFVENKGRNKDFSVTGGMIRNPR